MTMIDSLTAQLDSLLNDEEGVRWKEGKELEKDASDGEWQNMEEDVSDYLSVLNNGSRSKKNTRSQPLFPSDVSKSGNQFDLQVRKGGRSEGKKEGEKTVTRVRKNSSSRMREYVSSDDLAISTITDLSKKVRDLNAQLTATQNKLRLAQADLRSVKESQAKEVTKAKEPTEVSDDKLTLLEKQIKELSDKLSSSNTKLCEARNQLQQQKHEIKVLQKAMANEIGDNVNLQTVTSEGWRGRAQQIISLQQKVNDLTEKLSQTSIPSSEKTASTILLLEKAQDKERISCLTSELDETKSILNDTKNKNEQARARVKVLMNELNTIKAKYEAQISKNDEDVKLINTLTTRLTNISQKFHERERNLKDDYQDKMESLVNEYKQEKSKADQLKKIIIDRDSKIGKLEERIKDLKENQQERPPSSWSTFMERPPSRHSSMGGNVLPTTELERLRLMELVTVLNKRLDDERKTLENVQEQLHQEKHRSVRLETKCSRLELEKVGKGGSYGRRSTSSSSRLSDTNKAELSAAKDRIALLEEKILALDSRIERLRKEKEEDSRIYVRMVEDARQAVRDYSRKIVPSSNISLP